MDYCDQTRQVYNEIAAHWNTRREFCWKPVEDFYETIEEKEGSLIDLGCGNGRHLKLAQRSGFKDESLYGCDISEKQLETCKTEGFDKVIQCNFTEMPYPDNKFDYMICIAALHHIIEPELQLKALQEMYRIMKTGGQLLLSNWFPNDEYVKEQQKKGKISFITDNLIIVTYMKKHNRYYYLFKEDEILELCKKVNLQIISKRHFKNNYYLVLQK